MPTEVYLKRPYFAKDGVLYPQGNVVLPDGIDPPEDAGDEFVSGAPYPVIDQNPMKMREQEKVAVGTVAQFVGEHRVPDIERATDAHSANKAADSPASKTTTASKPKAEDEKK